MNHNKLIVLYKDGKRRFFPGISQKVEKRSIKKIEIFHKKFWKQPQFVKTTQFISMITEFERMIVNFMNDHFFINILMKRTINTRR